MNQQINDPSTAQLATLTELFNANKLVEAEIQANEITKNFPSHGFAWKVLGAILQRAGKLDESLEAKKKEAEFSPDDAEAYSNLANAYVQKRMYSQAEESCRKAIEIDPTLLSIYKNLGTLFQKQGRAVDAELNFQRILVLKPDDTDAHYQLGLMFAELGRRKEAEISYRNVMRFDPKNYNAPNQLGILLQESGKIPEAETAYRTAAEIQPNNPNIQANLGNVLLTASQFADAKEAYAKVLELDPNNEYVRGQYGYLNRMLCDWNTLAEDNAHQMQNLEKKKSASVPFILLSVPVFTAQHHKLAGKSYVDTHYKKKLSVDPYVKNAATLKKARESHDKLRIGYLSADVFAHATVHLLAGVLENRNTEHFQTYLYSYGAKRLDAARSRMENACDIFRDIGHLTDEDAAKIIVEDEIDILVDLKGYTQQGRMGVNALRPAPIIVSWLGYPGTLGHPRLADYIIGDPIVTPLKKANDYSETLALMPYCYQPNDNTRKVGERPTRAEAGLPAKGFVFCTFNQSYKITPEMFDIWCKLLHSVPDSVLWLLCPRKDIQENLKREAQARGIGSERIIFAPPLPQTQHLGRLQLADLAVDTFPYTSHTTASDALWAGIPLVTKMGETFASRVAASILQSMGLPDLVANDDEEYLNIVLNLAQHPERLETVRNTIAANKKVSPLFDTPRFARDLEKIYQTIWEQEISGKRKVIVIAPEEGLLTINNVAETNINNLKEKEKIKTDSPNKKQFVDKSVMINSKADTPIILLREKFESCPLCKSKKSINLFTTDSRSHALYNSALPSDLIWLKCADCYHIFTQYYWTQEGLIKVFSNAHDNQVAGGNIDQKRQTWKPVIHNVLTVLGGYSLLPTILPYPMWLDIGCGDGGLVMTAAEFGFNATGLDARIQTVQALNDSGYQAIQGDFMTTKIDDTPIVISMMDVLEHLPNPCEALQRAHSLLHPNGILVISLPNTDCSSWKLMGNANPYWIEIEHYHNFSRQRLSDLLNQYGFNVVHYDIPFRYKAQMELYAVKKG